MPKKKWVTPKLTVLVRSSENNILEGCKTYSAAAGPDNDDGACKMVAGEGVCGDVCSTPVSS